MNLQKFLVENYYQDIESFTIILYTQLVASNVSLRDGHTRFSGAVSLEIAGSSYIVTRINDNITACLVCKLLGYDFTK